MTVTEPVQPRADRKVIACNYTEATSAISVGALAFRLKTLPPEHPRYGDERLHPRYSAPESDLARLLWAEREIKETT